MVSSLVLPQELQEIIFLLEAHAQASGGSNYLNLLLVSQWSYHVVSKVAYKIIKIFTLKSFLRLFSLLQAPESAFFASRVEALFVGVEDLRMTKHSSIHPWKLVLPKLSNIKHLSTWRSGNELPDQISQVESRKIAFQAIMNLQHLWHLRIDWDIEGFLDVARLFPSARQITHLTLISVPKPSIFLAFPALTHLSVLNVKGRYTFLLIPELLRLLDGQLKILCLIIYSDDSKQAVGSSIRDPRLVCQLAEDYEKLQVWEHLERFVRGDDWCQWKDAERIVEQNRCEEVD
ncbi:hypothetical protein DL96DRAFT_1589429 [Flagelloscypha sp. PMI_526]|nr:hypothetical protein DL96DRAFT_1589429 [Flagelloscypha sp. PMI_526]